MDSILIYQAANDLVQNTGTRNIKRIARSCSLDISETPRFKDVLGFLSLHFDKPLIEKIAYFMKLVGWEQLATQGVPRWQVHKRVAGGSQRRGSVASPV